MKELHQNLKIILADTYALYLKTQGYHWHVKGANFKSLHELFEGQYIALAEAVDTIAERILTIGHKAPASFSELNTLKTITDGNTSLDADEMVKDLAQDHDTLVKGLNDAMALAQECHDEGSITLLSERIADHEKTRWMLSASSAQ